jgi:hypothetical protein
MHNNAVGPEICGNPANADNAFYRSPYADPRTKEPVKDAPHCSVYDPSVEGRYKVFVASARELLAPEEQRRPKITRFDVDVPLPFELRINDDGTEKRLHGFTVVIPQGTGAGRLGNFQHKAFINDVVLARLNPDELQSRLVKQLGEQEGKEMTAQLRRIGAEFIKDPARLIETARAYPKIIDAYSSCTADIENYGHRFGTDLADADKQALIAFLATL